jgi:hypothetical protein
VLWSMQFEWGARVCIWTCQQAVGFHVRPKIYIDRHST